MKKIILSLVLGLVTIFGVNAQTAIETPRLLDNTYVGVTAGATTPLSFDRVFPLNPTFGVRVGKEFTPIFGMNIEGTTWFGSAAHEGTRFDNPTSHNAFRSVNVGLNGTVNISNLLCGYMGTPRKFELSALAGFGWSHVFNPSKVAKDYNYLSAKTALDFNFNFGDARQHTFYVEPYVFWNLNGDGHQSIQFHKNRAQLGLALGYTYHFRTSNGTHHFKVYDVGAMQDEINRLRADLEAKPKEVVVEKVVERVVERVVEAEPQYIEKAVEGPTTVFFAFDSSQLDDDAMDALDKLGQNGVYDVYGYASSEGDASYNKDLSYRRARAVADYLRNRGATINIVEGCGATGPTSGRVAIVSAAK